MALQTRSTIKRGSTGEDVRVWQDFLKIEADGIFGPQTHAATVAFQSQNGLVGDGIVGPLTWAKAAESTDGNATMRAGFIPSIAEIKAFYRHIPPLPPWLKVFSGVVGGVAGLVAIDNLRRK